LLKFGKTNKVILLLFASFREKPELEYPKLELYEEFHESRSERLIGSGRK
jgi:hypothetical protein